MDIERHSQTSMVAASGYIIPHTDKCILLRCAMCHQTYGATEQDTIKEMSCIHMAIIMLPLIYSSV